ncbi:MAG: MobF family relaxase [Jatrophihabitans sp.]
MPSAARNVAIASLTRLSCCARPAARSVAHSRTRCRACCAAVAVLLIRPPALCPVLADHPSHPGSPGFVIHRPPVVISPFHSSNILHTSCIFGNDPVTTVILDSVKPELIMKWVLNPMMSLHKLTAGDGYAYLTRQVAANDASARGYKSLNDYYSAKGESPGQWKGAGLEALGIEAGAVVTEKQMLALFGEGRHPNSDQMAEAILAAPAGTVLGEPAAAIDRETRLGRLFPVYDGTSEFRDRLAEAYQAFNTVHDRPGNAKIEDADRARIRTDTAASMFAETHDRPPASEQEFSSYLAKISRTTSSAVAGYDLTFSPVKSFSAVWALADRPQAELMREAMQAAVDKTSTWFEENFAFTRVGPNGVRQVPVKGVVAVSFLHRDARSGEPDIHVHFTISAKVQTVDGRWLALDGRTLHKYAVGMSEYFNTQLEAEHVARVPGVRYAAVERPDGKRPTREIVGVPAKLNETFSSRRQQITDRLKTLDDKFRVEHGRVPSTVEQIKLAQQANLDTRQAKHEPRSEAEQRVAWRAQAEAAIGRSGLRRMFAQTRRPASSWEPVTDQVLGQAASATGAVVAESRATWQHNHVLAEATRQLRETGIHPAQVNQLAPAVAALVLGSSVPIGIPVKPAAELVPEPLRHRGGYVRAGSQLYTSPAVLAAEQRIVTAAGRVDGRIASPMDVSLALAEWSANHDGRSLNTSQTQMVTTIATEGRRVGLTLAPAGTGKTTAVGVVATAWQNSGGTVVGLAPSAAAARELGDAIGGVRADTLHKLVHHLTHDDPGRLPEWIQDFDSTTLLIIDEAGLAGTPLLDKAIDFTLSRGGRVQLIGDDRQQASAGAGGVLRDIDAAHGSLTLDEVLRFRDPAEKAASLALREGDATSLGYYLDHNRMHVATAETIADTVYEAWSRDVRAGKVSIMTAPTLEQVAVLNARARADRLSAAGGKAGRSVTIAGGETASAGDTIISKLNKRQLSLGGTDFVKNGDRWQVDQVHRNGDLSVIHLTRGKSIRLPHWYVEESVRLGYADTAVSVQGRTAGNARVDGTCHNLVDANTDRNRFYTIMTRGTAGNHAYLSMGSSDEHAVTQPLAYAPTTVAEMATAILARDGSDRSATTELRSAGDPHLALGRLADAYADGIETSALHLLGPDRVDALAADAERAIPNVTSAEGAWSTLQPHLATLALDGHDPITALTAAAALRELHTVRDPAAVLDWRLDPTGRHSQQPGPLDWLPALPAAVAADDNWRPYLQARAELVDHAARAVRVDVATWTPGTAPAWATPYLNEPELLADLAVWRAARSVPVEDLRAAGGRPHALALAHRYDDLANRALRHAGNAGDGAARWATYLGVLGARVGGENDPQWTLVASRLSLAETAGLPVPRLLAAAMAPGPLPAEHPSSALWWRLEERLSGAITGQPNRSHQLRPLWVEQLHAVLGDAITDRITSDRLWPAIVARMDTAVRGGADPAQLGHDAAGLLAVDRLAPDDLATVLLWQISPLDDPPPADHEPPVPDPLDDETAAPADAHLVYPDIDDAADTERAHFPPDGPDPDEDTAPEDLDAVLGDIWRTEDTTITRPAGQPPALAATALQPDPAPRLAATADAATYFQDKAAQSWVPDYLVERGLPPDIAGYAPTGWTNLVDHLRALGHDDQVLLDADLARTSSRGTLIDTYRDRLMLPITTPAGDIVSFIGRAPRDAGPTVPRYINGATTSIYSKSESPYGLDANAADRLRAGTPLLLVEGPLDVEAIKIAVDQAGADVVPIAGGGTAFGAELLRALNNIVPLDNHQVLVGFDADKAGQAAAVKVHDLLGANGVHSPSLVAFPAGSDPAQILQDLGPHGLAASIVDRRPLLDLAVDAALRPYLEEMASAPNDSVREHYRYGALTPALEKVLTVAAGQMRIDPTGDGYTRQFTRIAEALELPIGTVADVATGILFRDDEPELDQTEMDESLAGWFAEEIELAQGRPSALATPPPAATGASLLIDAGLGIDTAMDPGISDNLHPDPGLSL